MKVRSGGLRSSRIALHRDGAGERFLHMDKPRLWLDISRRWTFTARSRSSIRVTRDSSASRSRASSERFSSESFRLLCNRVCGLMCRAQLVSRVRVLPTPDAVLSGNTPGSRLAAERVEY